MSSESRYNYIIKNIIFDFDGVVLDSVRVKTSAFKKLFKDFPQDKVEQLLYYHQEHGGVSRYVKIKYFFEQIMKQIISDDKVILYSNKYSELTKDELSDSKYLIEDSHKFIVKNFKKYKMHIASGADENDLLHICEKLSLTKYFISIHGSPLLKENIISNILKNNNYDKKETCVIGDSVDDYESAVKNGVQFFGYNCYPNNILNFKILESMYEFTGEKNE